jgi:hypothetical protein
LKVIADRLVTVAGDQKRFDGIIHIRKSAQLLSAAEKLDLFAFNRQLYEPSGEALLRIPGELPGAVRVAEAQRNCRHLVHKVVNHVVPLAGHLVHPIHVDRLQSLRFDQRQFVRTPIRLARPGKNDARVAVFVLTRFKDGDRRGTIQAQISQRVVHGIDMRHVAGQIEDAMGFLDEPSHQLEIATVAFNHLDILSDRIDVEVVRSAMRVERIDDDNRSAQVNEPDSQIAADKAQPSGNQDLLSAVHVLASIHPGRMIRRRTVSIK